MARAINRLTVRGASSLKEPGLHADGRGLYLRIDQTSGKRWVLIFHMAGKRREMGLGGFNDVSLSEARLAAEEARALVRSGADPIQARKTAKAPQQGRAFCDVAATLLDDLERGWKWPRQRQQFVSSLKRHAPAIWAMDVADVGTEAVLAALRPIWVKQHDTATRVRMRIERVLDAAKVMGLRSGENPARWRGQLSVLMLRPNRPTAHFAAMDYREVPTLLKSLSSRSGASAGAMSASMWVRIETATTSSGATSPTA